MQYGLLLLTDKTLLISKHCKYSKRGGGCVTLKIPVVRKSVDCFFFLWKDDYSNFFLHLKACCHRNVKVCNFTPKSLKVKIIIKKIWIPKNTSGNVMRY